MQAKDVWATATGEDDGRTVIYRYRVNRPHRLQGKPAPYALEVGWPYDAETRNGMPPEDVNRAQLEFETAIEELGEGPLGWLMLIATGNGLKRWLFYVQDPSGWVERLNELVGDHAEYPLDLPNWSDPEWSVWSRFAESVSGAA